METVIGQNKINKCMGFIDKWFYSSWHIILIAVLTVIGWATGKTYEMLAVFFVLLSIILAVYKDTTPAIPILVMASGTVTLTKVPENIVAIALTMALPLLLAIVIRAIRFRKESFKMNSYAWALVLTLVVMMLGGAFSTETTNLGKKWGMVATVGFVPLAIYLITIQCMKPKVDLRVYFSKIMMWFGIMVLLEVAIFLWRSRDIGIYNSLDYKQIGWMNSNSGASALLLSAPFCFYLAIKLEHKSWFYIFMGILQIMGQLMFGSRGGTLFAALMAIVCLIALTAKFKNRRVLFINLAIWFITILSLVFLFKEEITNTIREIFREGISLTGRDILYREAFRVFIKNPIFGAGLGYVGIDGYNLLAGPLYFFHSTFFQIIGSFGIIGIIAFSVMYFERYKVFLRKGSRTNGFNIFALIAMLAFEGYAMINTGTFSGVPFLMIMHLIVGVCQQENLTALKEKGLLIK